MKNQEQSSSILLNTLLDKALGDVNIKLALKDIHQGGIANPNQSGQVHMLDVILEALDSCNPSVVFFETVYFASALKYDNIHSAFTTKWLSSDYLNSLTERHINKKAILDSWHLFFSKVFCFEDRYPIIEHSKFAYFPDKPLFFVSSSKNGDSDSFRAKDFFNELEELYEGSLPEFPEKDYQHCDGKSGELKNCINSRAKDFEVYFGKENFPYEYDKKIKEQKDKIRSERKADEKEPDGNGLSDIHRNNGYFRQCYDFIFKPVEKRQCSFQISIPILGSPYFEGNRDISNYESQGTIFLYFIIDKDKGLDNDEIRQLARKISRLFKDYSINFIFQLGRELYKKTLNNARKAAISQVFARNGSHNVGSHVLAKMITRDAAKAEFQWSDKKYKTFGMLTEVEDKDTALANFNSYLRDRMDFLADLSTSTPLMEASKMLMSDVLAGMDANRILMNYISGVGSFEYSLQLRDCRECEKKNCLLPCDIVKMVSVDNEDILVSMPNDVMGFQALYVIIENVIRNTAKHGGSREETHFTVEVRHCTLDDALYEVWIHDTCKKSDSLTDNEKEEYEEITGEKATNQTKKIDLIVSRQNDYINEPILDTKTNELRRGAWGMIEMKVAAAYLRKIPVETVDGPKYKVNVSDKKHFYTLHEGVPELNIIKAVNKNDCLGYVIHLMKPKELLVVDEVGALYNELSLPINVKKENTGDMNSGKTGLQCLKEKGIWVEKSVAPSEVYPHPIMYVIPKNGFDDGKYLRKDNLFKGGLPSRIIVQGKKQPSIQNDGAFVAWDEDGPIGGLSKRIFENSNSVIEEVWRIWLNHKRNHLKIKRIITLDAYPFAPGKKYANKFMESVSEIDGNTSERNRNFNIAIDSHGKEIFNAFEDSDMGACKYDHYEATPSAVNRFLEMARKEKNANNSLIDGILTSVMIIDERIQAIYQESFKPESKTDDFRNNRRRMKAANIHVPAVEIIDLNKKSFGPDDERNLHDSIEDAMNNSTLRSGIDFIVIHLGVIERVLEDNNKKKDKTYVKAFIQSITSKFNSRVVITSGRGKPDNLPDEVPFVTYSAISHYAVETPFKSYLNQSVQAARTFGYKNSSV